MSDRQADTAGQFVLDLLAGADDRLHGLDWYPIVKKEFSDTVRTRSLLLLTGLYLALFVLPLIVTLYTDLGGQAATAVTALVQGIAVRLLSVIVPISAIALTYAAISGERQRGSLKILLSLPYTRRDVVVGKLFGRFFVLGAPLVGTLLLQVLVVLPEAESGFQARTVAVLIGLTLLLALSFVGFTLGASAATSTTRRSLIAAGGIWVYLFALWNSVSRGIGGLLRDRTGLEQALTLKLELFVKLLNPTQAYQTLLQSLASSETTVAQARASMFGSLLGGRSSLIRQQAAAQTLSESVPWYLSDPMAVAVLLLWCVVPVAIGYGLFARADL
ncbi:ABC transporter permease subunit [Halomicroarcula sp. GCM10025709]|uniref:ABC transporter permease subunit n=1 Tax=Haloarcula TaxID=2237 RepID=UPI0024C20F65|nr:ABC transporter permease subunit [Halomicroarcula sp. YJ-61-S]